MEVYSFADRYCEAEWRAGSEVLSCPGASGDELHSFVLPIQEPKLESGLTAQDLSLWVKPEAVEEGFIAGVYPVMSITEGDRLSAYVGCLFGVPDCKVRFEIAYRAAGGEFQNLVSVTDVYDGRVSEIDLDLSPLAGEAVEFVLRVVSMGPSEEAHAVWVGPRIVR